jgi:chitin synthase
LLKLSRESFNIYNISLYGSVHIRDFFAFHQVPESVGSTMSFHQPDDSLASSLPSQPENVYLRPERNTLGSGTIVARTNPYLQTQCQSTASFETTLPGTPNVETYINEKAGSFFWVNSEQHHEERVKTLGDLNTMVDEKPEFSDPSGMKVRRAQRLMKVRKLGFQCCIFGLK